MLRRWVLPLAASAAVLAACAGLQGDPGQLSGERDLAGTEAHATDRDRAGTPPTAVADVPVGDGTGNPAPADTDASAPAAARTEREGSATSSVVVSVDDHGPVGTMGPALLRPEVPALTIEVLVQDGAAPDGRALDHLERVVTREVDKPRGVRRLQHVFRSDRRRWSADELRTLAAGRRQHRSTAEHAAVVVMYLRGGFEDDRVLGAALNASEVAVFPETWRDLVGGVLGAAGDVERSVLVHEVGHLFGLVELTYGSTHDRHDEDHPGHSSDRGSVMHWAIERAAVTQVFEGPPPNDFDEADRDDLRFLRTGSR